MFGGFVGNNQAKTIVETNIKAAIKKDDRLGNFLFSGMAGSGKTMLAKLMAKEASAVQAYVNASTVSSPDDVVAIMRQAIAEYNEIKNTPDQARRIVIIVDEAHALKAKVQDFLLTAISEDVVSVKENGGFRNYPIRRERGYNDFLSWVFISNRCGEIAQALRSRLVEVQFVRYTEENKIDIANRYMSSKNIVVDVDAIDSIANRGWSIRDVKNYCDEVYDYTIANDFDKITVGVVREYFGLVGVDEKGINTLEQEYLAILKEYGTASVQTLASKLGVGIKDVTELIEPKLIDQNIIGVCSGGRFVRETENDEFNPFVIGAKK